MSPDPTLLADSIRALVMIEFFALLGQSVAIILLYGRARRLASKALDLPKAKSRQMGLLPTHVTLVSLTFLALAAESAARTWARVGTGVTGWSIFNAVFFFLGNIALWEVVRFERTRIAEARQMMLFRIDPPRETVAVDEKTHEIEGRFPDST